jgi:hypothetical protein
MGPRFTRGWYTHETGGGPGLEGAIGRTCKDRGVDKRHRTHLTVHFARYIEDNQIVDHGDERSKADKGINLRGANQSIAHSHGKMIVPPRPL